MNINDILMEEFKLKEFQVKNTIKLIDDGNTIPFIARYRKEKTGELEDTTLRELNDRLQYLRNLEDRKEEVLRLIDEQDKLTKELERNIKKSKTLQRVEDYYRPYKQKRRTRAVMAKEKGLEPLADIILEQTISMEDFTIEVVKFVDAEKEVMNVEEAIMGAMDIIAEIVSDNPEYRKDIRRNILNNGTMIVEATDIEKKSVYEMYYEYKEPIKELANHRILAINRGEKEKFLKVSIDIDDRYTLDLIKKDMLKLEKSATTKYVEMAIEDGYKRLFYPSIEREVRNTLTEKAEEEAIKVFGLNLEPLLMQPPMKGSTVMGVDPGFRTGCKLAVIDETSKVLDFTTVYPTEPRNEIEKTKKVIQNMIEKYNIDIIAIGNGTASRETEKVVAESIREIDTNCKYIIISEAGASVYSASEVGVSEFPDLDVTIRGAISIGRRLQDPLAELVKIDPKHIGVGQYQHDLNQKRLDETLTGVVENSVNRVGVDLNTASSSLFSYVAGVSKSVAKNLVEHREKIGKYSDRKELLEVKGLGPKTFEQCAGFLRITDGDNFLDKTGVHPESYDVAKKLIEINYKQKDIEKISEELDVGIPTLKDIIKELEKPGRDIRDSEVKPILREDVLAIDDLKENMILKGTIRNVVDFGAFVDIGVDDDGLVHISELADSYINHPKDVVKVGDIVDVRIISIDRDRGRIGLSMKDI